MYEYWLLKFVYTGLGLGGWGWREGVKVRCDSLVISDLREGCWERRNCWHAGRCLHVFPSAGVTANSQLKVLPYILYPMVGSTVPIHS